MVFTHFYLIAGGSGSADINAGSTIGAAQATTTNGNWNATTGVFIAASGTPFASTIAGDYASVYVDGATVAVFVGKVLTVTSNVNITVDIASIKYGTAPSTSATGRSCTINGSWNTEQVLAAGGLATTTAPQSTKINIKGNLTVAASRTISMAGATTAPLWFSAYNTTPGDLDTDTTNALTKPIWTIDPTFALTASGAHQIWSGLSVVGNRSNIVVNLTGSPGFMVRCRVENTSSNALGSAIGIAGRAVVSYSWFKAPTTATTNGAVSIAAGDNLFVGCVAEGGGLAGFNMATVARTVFSQCVAFNNTGSGFLSSTGNPRILNCTVYNPTADGIKWSGTPSENCMVIGCLLDTCPGIGINNASGTNTNLIQRACNDFANCGTNEAGFGDAPSFFGKTEAGSIVTSSTDMTPAVGSNARYNGFPGVFENKSYTSYPYIGAVQRAVLAAFFFLVRR